MRKDLQSIFELPHNVDMSDANSPIVLFLFDPIVCGLFLMRCSGIDVLDNVMDLPTHTFVALDGIDWLLTHVTGLNNRYEAVALAQVIITLCLGTSWI